MPAAGASVARRFNSTHVSRSRADDSAVDMLDAEVMLSYIKTFRDIFMHAKAGA